MKSKFKIGDTVFYVNYSPIATIECPECEGWQSKYNGCLRCGGTGKIRVKWIDGWVEVINLGKILEIHYTYKGEVKYLTENLEVPILEEDLFSSLARALSYCKKNKLQLINPEVKTDASN